MATSQRSVLTAHRLRHLAATMATAHSSLTIGEVDGDYAVLVSEDLHVIRLPLGLLPPDVAVGVHPWDEPP